MKIAMLLAAALVLSTIAPPVGAASDAFVGARLIPIDGEEIADGVLVVENGRILAVGDATSVSIPDGARLHEVRGRVIMPGLVDTHSHIGGPSGGDRSAPIQPEVRVLDAIDVRSAGLQRAQAGGITTVNVMPGSGHLMSGQTIYLKLRDGDTIDELAILDDEGRPRGGMKMANGTNSRRDPPFPGTRAKSAALVRQAFVSALEYRDARAREREDGTQGTDRDLGKEALLEVLDGTRVVHHHTHRHDDILTVLRLKEEFGFRVVLHHVSDAWKVADRIAAADVPCSIILVDSPGGKLEARDIAFENGAALERSGVLVGFHTDDWITDSRLFLRMAALAVRAGMTRRGALHALTMAGARMLDLEDRVGSLAAGKDADFVLLSGDPFSVYTKVLETWVEGRKVFDRREEKDRLWAVGGYGAGDPRTTELGCLDEGESR
ncbi:MAG: amidohydrolase family protein [Acidobacteriota bacterium]|nr:amidohydrolase family protein [Acidobacteriota bacterium]